MTASLGSFDTNVLPTDAFELSGTEASSIRRMGTKAPWQFGTASATSKWQSGMVYDPGDVVYHDEDGLVYLCLETTSSAEPDYSDTAIEGTTWEWVGNCVSGFVSGRGYWTKFPDGTLIQRGATANMQTTQYSSPLYFFYVSVTLPVDFYDTVYHPNSSGNTTNGQSLTFGGWCKIVSKSSFSLYKFAGASNEIGTMNWTAIGRWKA